jgi:hypothetical protein
MLFGNVLEQSSELTFTQEEGQHQDFPLKQ